MSNKQIPADINQKIVEAAVKSSRTIKAGRAAAIFQRAAEYGFSLQGESLRAELQYDPYPEDIFPPLSSEQLKEIHSLLIEKLNIPIDRLSAQIGRQLRKGLLNAINRLEEESQEGKVSPVWVKASERLPTQTDTYWCRLIGNSKYRFAANYSTMYSLFASCHTTEQIEWLDESVQSTQTGGRNKQSKMK